MKKKYFRTKIRIGYLLLALVMLGTASLFGYLFIHYDTTSITTGYTTQEVIDMIKESGIQLGELEYMLVTSYGNQTDGNKGLTIPEFAKVCEMAGRELNPENGCLLAFNLDGGNSSLMVFGEENYSKKSVSSERAVSDIIYFATALPGGG